MTCTELISIIKQCGESGVKSLDIGTISLVFSENTPEVLDSDTSLQYNETILTPLPIKDEEDDDSESEDMNDLMFTDPERWDELARNGEE